MALQKVHEPKAPSIEKTLCNIIVATSLADYKCRGSTCNSAVAKEVRTRLLQLYSMLKVALVYNTLYRQLAHTCKITFDTARSGSISMSVPSNIFALQYVLLVVVAKSDNSYPFVISLLATLILHFVN